MAVLEVLVYPSPPLRERASKVFSFGPKLRRLADNMLETMIEKEGVGLAAPQVGVRQQFMVLCEPGGEPMCLANPEIIEMDGSIVAEEGCLSLPGIYAHVPRATRIRVRAQDVEGHALDFEARDFLARIIQHEYDHLHGKMFPDRLDIFTRDALYKEFFELQKEVTSDLSVKG